MSSAPIATAARVPAANPRWGWFWLAAAGAAALTVALPADTAFVNDEPWLIRLAWRANQEGRLAELSLPGSLGVRYHPVGVWFYQALLLVTHRLPLVVLAKALLMLGVTLGALWTLARRTQFSPWPILLVLLSAAHWYYCRLLWDNVLLIPTVAALVAAYAAWADTGSRRALAATTALAVLAVHLHPLGAVPVLALAVTALATRGRELWRRPLAPALAALAAAAVTAPYVRQLVREAQTAERLTAFHERSVADVVDSLLAVPWLSFEGFAANLELGLLGPHKVLAPWLVEGLTIVTWLALALLVLGAGVAAGRLWAAWRARRTPALPEQLAAAAGLIALLHTAVLLVLGQRSLPHYHNATWLAQFWLAWYGFEALRGRRPRLAVGVLLANLLALAVLLGGTLAFIHVTGGNRSSAHGATLRTQLAVAEALVQYPPPPATTLVTDVVNFLQFPKTMGLLMALAAERAGPPARPAGCRVGVTYRNPHADPDDGWLTVRELAPAAAPPPSAPQAKGVLPARRR